MSTTNLAFQLLAASNYIDALGGVSQSYRQALASYEAEAEAKPAVPVADGCQVVHVVMKEDGTIHLKKGDRSTWVGYKSDDKADQEWRAGCISRLLGHSGWDAAAPAAPAQAEAKPAPPFTPEERKALEKWVAAAPAAPAQAEAKPAPEPLTDQEVAEAVFDYYQHFHEAHRQEVAEGHFAKDLAIFRIAEKAHGIGIAASKGEQA